MQPDCNEAASRLSPAPGSLQLQNLERQHGPATLTAASAGGGGYLAAPTAGSAPAGEHQAGAAAAGDLPDAATAAAGGGDAVQAGSEGGSEGGSGTTRIGPITRYYMKRVNSNVVHVLFFVVDDEGRAQLAVVGTDVKMSGHFVYSSVQDFPAAAPLRCTNRQQVMEWLAGLGAGEAAEENEVVLPDLSSHQWQALNTSDPSWARPKLDREYTTYREETGVLPDGRHFKNYYLVHEGDGAERLMVTAEDSVRKDRRYTYKAVTDVGGFCFENGKAVTDWLDYILGRVQDPPDFMMRRDSPARRKRKREGSALSGDTMPDYSGRGYQPDPYGMYDQPGNYYGTSHYPPGGYGSPAHHFPFSPYDAHHQQQQEPLRGHSPYSAAAAGSGGPGGSGDPYMSGSHAMAAAGAEVRAVFSSEPDLLQWVTAGPTQRDVTTLTSWGDRLRACTISSTAAQEALLGGTAHDWIHTGEAVEILQMLEMHDISLRLLELSGISRPVAMLRCHPDPQIATLAARVTQRWRAIAQAALNRASTALGGYLPWHHPGGAHPYPQQHPQQQGLMAGSPSTGGTMFVM